MATLNDGYGIRWAEFNRRSELVTRERFFETAKARETFAIKLEMKPAFDHFVAWSGPTGAV